MELSKSLKKYIEVRDIRAKKLYSLHDSFMSKILKIIDGEEITIGRRETCSSAHFTLHISRMFSEIVFKANKEGIKIVGNNVAGIKNSAGGGGYWRETTYKLDTTKL